MQSQKIERWLNTEINIDTSRLGPGLHNCTTAIQRVIDDCDINNGVCHVFVKHTSASLLIQENADPSARADLEMYFGKIARKRSRLYIRLKVQMICRLTYVQHDQHLGDHPTHEWSSRFRNVAGVVSL